MLSKVLSQSQETEPVGSPNFWRFSSFSVPSEPPNLNRRISILRRLAALDLGSYGVDASPSLTTDPQQIFAITNQSQLP
ncbi:hypothetical protein ACR2V4_27225, partial [Klebsiella pneumoniae]